MRGGKREKTKVRRCTGRSYAKCESSDEFVARHLRSRLLCSFLYISLTEVSLAFFVRRDIGFYPSTPAFRARRALLFGAPRVKGSRYRGFPSKFSKPRIKRRIELCGWHREEEREGDDGEMRKRRKTERGREPMRGSIRLYSKGGTTAAAASVGYDDEVIPSSFPQDMTSHLDVINTNISGSCGRFRRGPM